MPKKTRKQKIKATTRRHVSITQKKTPVREEVKTNHSPQVTDQKHAEKKDKIIKVPQENNEDAQGRAHFIADFRKSLILAAIVFTCIIIAKYVQFDQLVAPYLKL